LGTGSSVYIAGVEVFALAAKVLWSDDFNAVVG
jgi:hypothetical protein